ncbi:MAG: putative quinol monooxygenase [Verrucomicrobiales bacterium]
MLIVHVHVQVKPELVDTFIEETAKNVHASRLEPGIETFELLQQEDDATRFLLIEVYKTSEASSAHKATPHYAAWRDAVAPMMAAPRQSTKFKNLIP